MENIDIEKLRRDLKDFFGTAAFSGYPVAYMDLIDVENASDEELINIAIQNNFNLDDYLEDTFDLGL